MPRRECLCSASLSDRPTCRYGSGQAGRVARIERASEGLTFQQTGSVEWHAPGPWTSTRLTFPFAGGHYSRTGPVRAVRVSTIRRSRLVHLADAGDLECLDRLGTLFQRVIIGHSVTGKDPPTFEKDIVGRLFDGMSLGRGTGLTRHVVA